MKILSEVRYDWNDITKSGNIKLQNIFLIYMTKGYPFLIHFWNFISFTFHNNHTISFISKQKYQSLVMLIIIVIITNNFADAE